jgi:hypothetical protein
MTLFQPIIAQAIAQGVSEKTIVLFLLLPLVASLVGAFRHLIGFRGLGIFIPTALALAFYSTGIGVGLLLFGAILLAAMVARRLMRRLRIHYLPRMALLLWFVSLAILALIFISPYFGIRQLTTISIFPVLILILLAEEFIEVQIGKSLSEAKRLTAETLLIALVGFLVLSLRPLQRLALQQPLWVILAPLVFNLLVGRFTGLRLLEYRRFRKLLK